LYVASVVRREHGLGGEQDLVKGVGEHEPCHLGLAADPAVRRADPARTPSAGVGRVDRGENRAAQQNQNRLSVCTIV
jgi:hypothetical protein